MRNFEKNSTKFRIKTGENHIIFRGTESYAKVYLR